VVVSRVAHRSSIRHPSSYRSRPLQLQIPIPHIVLPSVSRGPDQNTVTPPEIQSSRADIHLSFIQVDSPSRVHPGHRAGKSPPSRTDGCHGEHRYQWSISGMSKRRGPAVASSGVPRGGPAAVREVRCHLSLSGAGLTLPDVTVAGDLPLPAQERFGRLVVQSPLAQSLRSPAGRSAQ
jgi:hypothetical protein